LSKVAQQVIIEEIAPDYWEQACAELMKHDRILKKLIPKYGSGFLRTRGDAFTTLARSIVGQQISVAAAQSVWSKVLLVSKNKVIPKNILKLSTALISNSRKHQAMFNYVTSKRVCRLKCASGQKPKRPWLKLPSNFRSYLSLTTT
jgi:hypothetical protein